MNKRVKKLWIKALRSGEVNQARHRLRRGASRCCLGVLCDVFAATTGKGKWEHRRKGGWVFSAAAEVAEAVLPAEVVKWAQLPNDNPAIADGYDSYASRFNDSGESFEQIADRIEKYL